MLITDLQTKSSTVSLCPAEQLTVFSHNCSFIKWLVQVFINQNLVPFWLFFWEGVDINNGTCHVVLTKIHSSVTQAP